jgi:sporulation protein YlmC with PRC-barrel domain
MNVTHPLQGARVRWWSWKGYLVVGILAVGIIAGKAVWEPMDEEGYQPATSSRVLLSEDQLIGDRVVNSRGEMLGVINDVIVDLSEGQLTYALVSPEGFTGFGDEVVPVPWSAMGKSANQHEFVLNVTRQEMENSPRFFKDKRPDLDEPCWDGDFQEFNNGIRGSPPDDRNERGEPEWPPLARQ